MLWGAWMMRASFSSWLQLTGWTADVPAAAADMHEEGSDMHATQAPRMPAPLASPRRRLFGGRSCPERAVCAAELPRCGARQRHVPDGRPGGRDGTSCLPTMFNNVWTMSINIRYPPAAAAFGRSCIPGNAWASGKGERPRTAFWRALWGLGATSASACLPNLIVVS